MNHPKTSKVLDFFGMSLSIGCAVHCFGISLLFILLPNLASAAHESDHSHALLLAPVIPVAIYSVRKSLQSGTSKLPAILAILGIVLLLVDVLHPIHLEGAFGLHLIPILGSLFLIASHSLSLLRGSSCPHKTASKCSQTS